MPKNRLIMLLQSMCGDWSKLEYADVYENFVEMLEQEHGTTIEHFPFLYDLGVNNV